MMSRMFKDCPFCGASVDLSSVKISNARYGNIAYVECKVCGARSRAKRMYDIDECTNELSELWNTRCCKNAEQDP